MPIGVPYAQLVLAAQVEDIADVAVSGYSRDGVIPITDEVMKQVKKFKPDVVGITIDWAFLSYANIELAKRVKEWNPDVTVIAGGQHATWTADELVKTGLFDAVFLGEAEISLREYVKNGDFKKIPGVLYADGDDIINTGRAPCIDLDELKPPAYHLLEKEGLRLAMAIESSRGCPYQCDFCETRNFFGNGQYRKMSPRHFVKNLSTIVDRVGGGFFALLDDIFTLDMKGHVKEICERLIAEDLPVQIVFNSRTEDLAKNLDMIPILAKAGFRAVLLGIESIFAETLKSMHKGAYYNTEDIRRIFKACENSGISPFTSVLFGYDETPEMVSKTFDFLISLDPFCTHINIATPFPGSDLYKRALANNEIITTDYRYYDRVHRVWTKIPESTMEAVAQGRRRFYLRPEHIYRINKMGLDNPGVEAYIGVGLLALELSQEERGRPGTAEEWKTMITGYNQVLQDRFVPKMPGYNKILKFDFGQASVILTVKNGVIEKIKTGKEKDNWDMNLSIDEFSMLELITWNCLDILSSFVLGNVTADVSLAEKIKFISWFTDAQETLRWVGRSKMQVPRLRHTLQDWFEEDETRQTRLKELFSDGTTLYIGDKKKAGLKFRFSEKAILDVSLGLDPEAKFNFEITLSETEVENLFNGGLTMLYEILASREIEYKSAEKEKYKIDAPLFFENMKRDFMPEKAAGVDIVVQYQIDNDPGRENWWVQIQNQAIRVEQGVTPKKPTIEIYIKMANFLKMANRLLTPMELFCNGDITYKGSPYFMLELAKCMDNPYVGQEQIQRLVK
jgi:radical SAM superfamily enzyme YgiQ (UPF0313 family)